MIGQDDFDEMIFNGIKWSELAAQWSVLSPGKSFWTKTTQNLEFTGGHVSINSLV